MSNRLSWKPKFERAGRAPYNFVPLPESARLTDEGPPSASGYDAGLLSGEIRLKWKSLSPFYIRGMQEMSAYKPENNAKIPQPFEHLGKLRIPGSTQKGMFRSLLEIVAGAPLDPVNDSQMFFRTVASVADPVSGGNSFEPHAAAYKGRVFRAEANSPVGVQVGYLYGGRDSWNIRPAQRVDGLQCFQVELATGEFYDERKRKTVDRDLFNDKNLQNQYTWKPPKAIWFKQGRPNRVVTSGTAAPGYHEGKLICSGSIPGKRHQWVVCIEDRTAIEFTIPKADINAYLESGVTPDIEKHRFAYSNQSNGVPCFYVKWADASGQAHVSFGHTHNFRIPYVHTVHQAIPNSCHRQGKDPRWDIAEAIFGRKESDQRKGGKARVQFQDATFISGPQPPTETEDKFLILGNPKPTTFQHYAVQPSEKLKPDMDRYGKEGPDHGVVHWDGDYKLRGQGFVRGWKRYWHRIGVKPPFVLAGEKPKVSTVLRPAKKDCVFHSSVKFENLRAHEFGALLTLLELPKGCAHQLGMAKPHGFGSFQVDLDRCEIVTHKTRYATLFASMAEDGNAIFETGKRHFDAKEREGCRNQFAAWALNKHEAAWTDLWSSPRLKELQYMMTTEPMLKDWLNRTRYLQLDRPYNRGKKSEYDTIADRNGDSISAKRRPLPPASQVFTDERMPSDSFPDAGPQQRR